MTVLILSKISDLHTQAVMAALASQGAQCELVDTSEFPARLTISLAYDGPGRRFSLHRRSGGFLDFLGVHTVWWWRPQSFQHAGMAEAHRRFAFSEAETAFQGLYEALDAYWVNPPARDAAASHKPYQLALAQKIGLAIPPTLMTNDVREARSFFREYEGEVIYKQFIALPDCWRETRRLTPDDETQAASIALAPVIFQKHVAAVADLRIIVVAGELYAAATDVRQARYPQDVRMNLEAKYKAHELLPDTAMKLRELMTELGLIYGAIDMRLTPEGRYVFLEINPGGQFLYIEKATGQPIASALAKTLIAGRPSGPCKEVLRRSYVDGQ